MQFFKDSDVTSDSEIQYLSPMRCQGKGGVHPPETGSGGRGSDGTASAMEGLRRPEAREKDARETGSQRSLGMMGEEGVQLQVGATWKNRHVAGVNEALA